MKCYKNVFKLESLKKNYAFFLFIFLLAFYFLSFFLFYFKYYDVLINTIKKIQEAKNNLFSLRKINRITTNNNIEMNDKKTSLKSKRCRKNEYIELEINKSNDELFPPKRKKGRNKKHKEYINNNINDLSNKKKSIINEFDINDRDNYKILKNNKDQYDIDIDNYKKYKEILKYNDNELNSLNYKKAL